MDHAEFLRFMRAGLKISKDDLPDYQIQMLIKALDDDDSGSVGIDELSDFVQRGTRTFNSGPEDDAAAVADAVIDSWDKPKSNKHKPKKKRRVDEAVARKLQARLKAQCYGTTPDFFFSRWDRDGVS